MSVLCPDVSGRISLSTLPARNFNLVLARWHMESEENAFTASFNPFGGTPPLFEQSTLNDFLLYLTLLNTTHVGSKFS